MLAQQEWARAKGEWQKEQKLKRKLDAAFGVATPYAHSAERIGKGNGGLIVTTTGMGYTLASSLQCLGDFSEPKEIIGKPQPRQPERTTILDDRTLDEILRANQDVAAEWQMSEWTDADEVGSTPFSDYVAWRVPTPPRKIVISKYDTSPKAEWKREYRLARMAKRYASVTAEVDAITLAYWQEAAPHREPVEIGNNRRLSLEEVAALFTISGTAKPVDALDYQKHHFLVRNTGV